MLESPPKQWTTEDAVELYNLNRWGAGYFDIDSDGFIVVQADKQNRPGQSGQSWRLMEIVQSAVQRGLQAPFLVRFPDLIRRRADEIHSAFASAIRESNYTGSYRCFYPIKVNQHFEVIQAAMQALAPNGGGLEAGSKAELLAAITITDSAIPILCNGFKDRSIVEMALRAIQLGRDLTIIIEKPNEIDLVLEGSRRLGIRPKLGLRVKLASRTGGHWQSSSGAHSKFGLSAPELMLAIDQLRQNGMLDQLRLLHFHPGSQITNVRKIKSSLIEVGRIYVNLVQQGVPLKTIDVGGGLAVDYTGQQNKDPSSMNYTLGEYANDVIHYIQLVCGDAGVPHPDIISESGRALVAHHSVLIVPVIGTSGSRPGEPIEVAAGDLQQITPLAELKEIYDTVNGKNLLEDFHDAQTAFEMALQMFSAGTINLEQRATAERLHWSICRRINQQLDSLDFIPRELENLRHQLADTYFGNFSLFQALPDSWALNQVFPIVPIHRLNERPARTAVLGDITCDSDGHIDCFIGATGQRNSLPVHELRKTKGQPLPYYLGIFLVGAYQEALSDDHNLMGKFHIINVHGSLDEPEIVVGSTLLEVLAHVHHEPLQISRRTADSVSQAIQSGRIDAEQGEQIQTFFDSIRTAYTYLNVPPSPSEAGSVPLPHHTTQRPTEEKLKCPNPFNL